MIGIDGPEVRKFDATEGGLWRDMSIPVVREVRAERLIILTATDHDPAHAQRFQLRALVQLSVGSARTVELARALGREKSERWIDKQKDDITLLQHITGDVVKMLLSTVDLCFELLIIRNMV